MLEMLFYILIKQQRITIEDKGQWITGHLDGSILVLFCPFSESLSKLLKSPLTQIIQMGLKTLGWTADLDFNPGLLKKRVTQCKMEQKAVSQFMLVLDKKSLLKKSSTNINSDTSLKSGRQCESNCFLMNTLTSDNVLILF